MYRNNRDGQLQGRIGWIGAVVVAGSGAAARLRRPPKWIDREVRRLEEMRLRLGRHGDGAARARGGRP